MRRDRGKIYPIVYTIFQTRLFSSFNTKVNVCGVILYLHLPHIPNVCAIEVNNDINYVYYTGSKQ